MLCALSLILTLATAPTTSARLTVKDGQTAIQVVRNGVKAYIGNEYAYAKQAPKNTFFEGGSLDVLFHGSWFSGERYRVQNKDTKEWGQPFDKTVNGCGGGYVFDGKMVWVYYVADVDTSCEPITGVYAFIMDEKNGMSTLEKTVELPGIYGYGHVMSVRHGDWLMVYSSANGDRSLGILNLRSLRFKIIAGVKPNYPGATKVYDEKTPDSGYFAICQNGNIYANIGDMLSLWNWKELKWKPIRKLKAQLWMSAYDLGHDDLLVGFEGMALAHRGKVFSLPQSRDLYISPKLGIGVIYNASFPFAEGVLLNPKDLTRICKVEKRNVSK